MAKDKKIEKAVLDFLQLQSTLEETEASLMKDERFRTFLELQKSFKEQSQTVWDNVEKQMIENNVKGIKGDWGSLTIAERLSWDIDSEGLQPRFYKKVVDTTKLSKTYRLEGKAPKGATPVTTQYLMKRIK